MTYEEAICSIPPEEVTARELYAMIEFDKLLPILSNDKLKEMDEMVIKTKCLNKDDFRLWSKFYFPSCKNLNKMKEEGVDGSHDALSFWLSLDLVRKNTGEGLRYFINEYETSK